MNIKQTADASGVSARNIRYYEQAGLLAPARNPENDYRIYTDADVRTLKLIRVLRTLDMPVENIRAVLSGTLPLTEAAERQRRQLRQGQADPRRPAVPGQRRPQRLRRQHQRDSRQQESAGIEQHRPRQAAGAAQRQRMDAMRVLRQADGGQQQRSHEQAAGETGQG